MKSFDYIITDPVGIHARPAGLLVAETKRFASRAVLHAGGKSAELTKLMKLMSLGIKQGARVTVEVEGDDEAEAAEALEQFFKSHF